MLFVLYWLISLKKQCILSTVILIIGWLLMPKIYKFSGNSSSLNDDIKVMSYNVRIFNYWKWTNEKNSSNSIKDFIKKQLPDIILIQENYDEKKNNLMYPYRYVRSNIERQKPGLAIFSKFPIINKGDLNFKNTSNDAIFVDIVKKKDTIRVYNFHLQSLHLRPGEENFGQENSEKLIERLKEGFTKQAEQTKIFLAHEKKWKGKKIIGGDFNNTSYSWVYNQISKNKKDAFIEAGTGFGKTFDYWFPMRIDFILTDEKAIINQFTTFTEKNSDHFPILARINW